MSEMMISSGSVKTVINNKVVQDKEYALKHDGKNTKFGIKDGLRGKLVLGKLNNKELNDLLLNKNEKVSLKDNLEKLLPNKRNKNNKKKKRGTKKNKKKKQNITLKIEEKKKRKNRTKKKRKKKSKENRLKDFFNFLN